MSTIYPFRPSNIRAPSFTATLDGANYNIVATWNVASQRYFINVYDMAGNWIVTVPIITSPPAEPVTSLTYDVRAGLVTVTKASGYRRKVGQMIDYTLMGFQPLSLNAKFRCLTTGDLTFTFPLITDPGPVTVLGTANRVLSMVSGFFTSTLIYRNGCFETDP